MSLVQLRDLLVERSAGGAFHGEFRPDAREFALQGRVARIEALQSRSGCAAEGLEVKTECGCHRNRSCKRGGADTVAGPTGIGQPQPGCR